MLAKISLHREIFCYSETSYFLFLGTNDLVFGFFHFFPHCNDIVKDKLVF